MDTPPFKFDVVLAEEEKILGPSQKRAALCLSGGGIRSATFALGILQALAQAGVLEKFDYLSTVSGGGYIGAWLSAWIRRSPKDVNEGLKTEHGTPFNYLRANSQYLRAGPSNAAPGPGALLGLYGQKTFLTLFLLLPVLAGLASLPYLLPVLAFTPIPPMVLSGLGILSAAYAQFFLSERSFRGHRLREFNLFRYVVPETVCALTAIRLSVGPFSTAAGCYVGAAVLAFLMTRIRWAALPSLVVSTAVQLLGVWLLAGSAIAQNPLLMTLAALVQRMVVNVVFCEMLSYFDRKADTGWASVARAWLGNIVVLLIVIQALALRLPRAMANLPTWAIGLIASGVVAMAAIFAGLVYRSVEINPRDKRSGKLPGPLGALFHLAAVVTMAGMLAATGSWLSAHANMSDLLPFVVVPLILAPLATGLFVDANSLSLHGMYRDSLVRAFLGASRRRAPDPITGLDRDDDEPLAELAQRPYPVICAARKNIGPLSDTPFERATESFTFTPLHCGTSSLGYRPTNEYGGGISHGTAIAASGAAVSPNLTEGSGYIALLRTILNPHLGVWLPNPARRWWKNPRPLLAQTALLKDLTGAGHANDSFIYVSDGGHFENLGLYEMIRRRCHYIVVVDAARDITRTADDLANAVAKVRADFNVAVDIDPSSNSHYSIGAIRYHDLLPDGVLIYIKPLLTGDEPLEISNYHALNPDFPHETTADQFFTEAQFESYRLLAKHSLAPLLANFGPQSMVDFVVAATDSVNPA